MSGQDNTQEKDNFQQIQERSKFEIMQCSAENDFNNTNRFTELELNDEQKMQINELLQHIPTVAAAGTMARAYTVKFPKGLPHTLMSLKQGGFGSSIMENGRIVGSASFYSTMGQAAFLGIFTAMSIATGQFFLTQINEKLHMINMKLDEILQFLYGEKRAELLSEVDFVKCACDNYVSIMTHEAQRIATIVNIQEAKKVAMKDIEFYMNDLSNQINSCKKDYNVLINRMNNEIGRAKDNLDLSMQLYLMSNMLEVHYAQNYEADYIKKLEENIRSYLGGYDLKIRDRYTELDGKFKEFHEKFKGYKSKKNEEEECRKYREEINTLKNSQDEKYNILSVLHTSIQEYYVTEEGSVYYKIPSSPQDKP